MLLSYTHASGTWHGGPTRLGKEPLKTAAVRVTLSSSRRDRLTNYSNSRIELDLLLNYSKEGAFARYKQLLITNLNNTEEQLP